MRVAVESVFTTCALLVLTMPLIVKALPFFHDTPETVLPPAVAVVRQPASVIVFVDVPDLRQLAALIVVAAVGVPRRSVTVLAGTWFQLEALLPTLTLADHGTMATLEKYGVC